MANRISRRAALAGLGAAASVATLPRIARAQNGPIRIGYQAPLSGSQEIIGKAQLLGAQIAVDQINKDGGVLGRQLELVIRDDKSDAAAGVAAVRELAGTGSNIIAGSFASPVMLAVAPILASENVVFMTQASAVPALTHEGFVRNLFRPHDYTFMRQRALGRLMAEKFPDADSWGAVNAQNATAATSWKFFADGLLQYYPEVAKKEVTLVDPVTAPFGSPDYRNEITQALRLRAKGLYLNVYGGDLITFLRQAEPYGLVGNFGVVADPGSEYFVPQTLKKETPKGMWTGHHWYFGAYEDNPVSKTLYDEIVARTGDKFPQGYTGEAHTAIRAIASGIKRAQSTETDAMIAAMEGMTFDSCKGERTFRKEDHQAIVDVNFVSFEPDDSEQGWKVADHLVIKGADVMAPPSPGQPAPLNFFKG